MTARTRNIASTSAWLHQAIDYAMAEEGEGDFAGVIRNVAGRLREQQGVRLMVGDADKNGAPMKELTTDDEALVDEAAVLMQTQGLTAEDAASAVVRNYSADGEARWNMRKLI